jgi:hypothetical protein
MSSVDAIRSTCLSGAISFPGDLDHFLGDDAEFDPLVVSTITASPNAVPDPQSK